MYSEEKQLKMLVSNKASVRYDACEWIRVSQESSPEIVTALEKATHDANIDVAERARLALQADPHHRMAIKMGMIEPDKTGEKEEDQSGDFNDRNTIRKPSKLGIATFAFSILALFSFIYCLLFDNDIFHGLTPIGYIFCVGSPIVSLISVVLGSLDLSEKDSDNELTILGMVISGMIIVLYILFFFL